MWGQQAAAAPQAFPVQGSFARGMGLSNLAFKPTAAPGPAEQLACASWDNCVYTYNVRTDAAGRCSAAQEVGIARLPQPAMDITYGAMNTPYANMAFAACADNGVYMVQNGTAVQKIGAFAAPVSAVRCVSVSSTPMVVASGWDRSLKYFDPRTAAQSGRPAFETQLSERVYCMDAKNSGTGGVLVACTADRNCHVYDLTRPQQPILQPAPSALKMAPRCVDVSIDLSGYTVGSVEGRISVVVFNDTNPNAKKSFAFKCHRGNPKKGDPRVWPVNHIRSTRFGTFASCGADGLFNFWDKSSKQRLKVRSGVQQGSAPISAMAINSASTILAFSEGYDWHKGSAHANAFGPPKLSLYAIPPKDVMPKAPKR
jgi:mRNA export factor